jgi:N-methylhydantoinase B/oxoprolinase/acetone carboxylase alpha subunit
MTMSLLSERRSRAPPGLCGGHAAAAGLNLLMRSDGIDINVGAKARLPVQRGDIICINTPGGLVLAFGAHIARCLHRDLLFCVLPAIF